MKMESVLASKGPSVITIGEGPLLREAVGVLVEHNIGALVVVDGNRVPLGILSERDILRTASAKPDFLYLAVGEVMTRDLVCASPGDDVDAVLRTMTLRHFRHMPITENGALIGIVSIGDLVKAQLDAYRGDIDTLQTQLMES